MVEEVVRSLIEVPIQQCRNKPLEVLQKNICTRGTEDFSAKQQSESACSTENIPRLIYNYILHY